jgi:DNA-binding NtrC family response regulator
MSKTILDVGQCGFDGPRMTKMLEGKVGVEVDTADSLEEAAEKLQANSYDLVLVNRQLAFEGSAGLDLIRQMKGAGDATPVMLVSDKADAQREAEACGATHGFGKSKMNDPGTVQLIKRAIGLA